MDFSWLASFRAGLSPRSPSSARAFPDLWIDLAVGMVEEARSFPNLGETPYDVALYALAAHAADTRDSSALGKIPCCCPF